MNEENLEENYQIKAKFCDHYRQNRHKTKKTKLSVRIIQDNESKQYNILCRLRRNGQILFDFPNNFPMEFCMAVISLYPAYEIFSIFGKMKRKKCLR